MPSYAKSTKRSTSIRLSNEARAQLENLSAQLGISQAAVMEIAIRKLHQQETTMPSNKRINLHCDSGQTAYDAIDEAIRDGDLPANATLGPRERSAQGWFGIPTDAVEVLGSVTVRAYESFYIVCPISAPE